MPHNAYRGQPPPAGPRAANYEVVGVSRGKPLDLTILDEMILGVSCHWVIDEATKRGRSRVCYKHEGECPHCGKHRKFWMGFLAAYDHETRRRVVLRMGDSSGRAVNAHSAPLGGLRGLRLKLSSVTLERTSNFHVQRAREEPLLPLPPAHSIEPTICRVLGCDGIPDYRRAADEIEDSIRQAEGEAPQ